MVKHKLQFLSFYITNVCPRTCNNCSTFNNLAFKKHLDWNANKESAAKWVEFLDVEEFSIMGGEPLLHPQIEEWALGLKEIWKDHTNFRLVTGVRPDTLIQKKDLIKTLLKAGIILEVSAHDPADKDGIVDALQNVILKEYFEELKITSQAWTINNDWPQEQLFFMLNSQMLAIINSSWIFAKAAIDRIENGTIYMHHSDKDVAHSNCAWRDCHYLVEGRLYKCLLTGVGNQLKEQFTLDERSKRLLDQSTSISPFDDIEVIDNFLNTIGDAIDQCSLCPANHTDNLIKIYPADTRKIKV
jgi:hypothetical protein